MAGELVTKQELIDAKADVATVRDVVNGGPEDEVTTRLGETVKSLRRMQAELLSSTRITVASWADLSGAEFEDRIVGTGAEVVEGDAGTHTDPVLGTSVSNSGIFSKADEGWTRVGDNDIVSAQSLLDGLNALLGFTPSDPYGSYPLVTGSDNFGAGTTSRVATAPQDGPLLEVSTWVAAVGSGAAKIVIAEGTLPNVTFVSVHDLPAVASTGKVTWTPDHFGDVQLEAGQHVLILAPAGGITQTTSSVVGKTLYFVSAEFTSGSTALNAAGGYDYKAYAVFGVQDLMVSRSKLVDGPLLDILDDMVGPRTATSGVYPLVTGADNFANNYSLHVFTAAKACPLLELGAWAVSAGSGAINLVVASGALSDAVFKSSHALTASVGYNAWDTGDFGDIQLEAGDMVFLSCPAGGATLMTTTVSGKTIYFAAGTFTGGTKAFGAGSNYVFHTYVKYGIEGLSIEEADLSPELIEKLGGELPLPTVWDMFLITGQSNAVGSAGGATQTRQLPSGIAKQFYGGSLVDITSDPVGNSNGNSAWPSFAYWYWKQTGRGVIFVPAAQGSSVLAAPDAGSGSWGASGSLRGAAITMLNAARAAADTASLAWQFAGVIWCQGEQDAVAIDASTIVVGAYNPALQTLVDYFETNTGSGSTMPFLISVIGSRTVAGGGDTTGFQQIRQAQIDFSHGNDNVFIGWTGAKKLVARNMMYDGVHYSAAGYDDMGYHLAMVASRQCVGRA